MLIELDGEPEPPVWPDGHHRRTARRRARRRGVHAAIVEAFAEEWGFQIRPWDEFRERRFGAERVRSEALPGRQGRGRDRGPLAQRPQGERRLGLDQPPGRATTLAPARPRRGAAPRERSASSTAGGSDASRWPSTSRTRPARRGSTSASACGRSGRRSSTASSSRERARADDRRCGGARRADERPLAGALRDRGLRHRDAGAAGSRHPTSRCSSQKALQGSTPMPTSTQAPTSGPGSTRASIRDTRAPSRRCSSGSRRVQPRLGRTGMRAFVPEQDGTTRGAGRGARLPADPLPVPHARRARDGATAARVPAGSRADDVPCRR